MTQDILLWRIARRYRDGEELETLGDGALIRFEGLRRKVEARKEAIDAGYTNQELYDMVAQIDVEEDHVR